MKRGWKILGALTVVLAILLAVNTLTVSSQTKEAEPTVPGGQILELTRGDVQVTDTGPPDSGSGQPIVLLHPYGGSLRWFDRIEPLLAERHRVIRVDLIGFGGSEKPETGYEISEQAATVAEALNRLDVEGALVAGNSMGASVATSLAEQASQLVDRAVLLDMAPNTEDYGDGLPFLARLGYTPVIGQAMWRVAPDFAVRDAYADSFAPGYDLAEGFEDPDQVVEDFRDMTYTSYDAAPDASEDFAAELPLDERFKRIAVPLMVVFGSEDQIFDAEAALEAYEDVPGVRTELVAGAGHAPQVEDPSQTARLLEAFAVDSAAPAEKMDRSKKRASGGSAKGSSKPNAPRGNAARQGKGKENMNKREGRRKARSR